MTFLKKDWIVEKRIGWRIFAQLWRWARSCSVCILSSPHIYPLYFGAIIVMFLPGLCAAMLMNYLLHPIPIFQVSPNYRDQGGSSGQIHTFCCIRDVMIWLTRGIPYYFQNFDSFYPLFFLKKYTSLVYFLPYYPKD